jgi:hypothetical protein
VCCCCLAHCAPRGLLWGPWSLTLAVAPNAEEEKEEEGEL